MLKAAWEAMLVEGMDGIAQDNGQHATGKGGTSLERSAATSGHRRVEYATATRVDVQVLSDDRGLVTFGRGLGGRT